MTHAYVSDAELLLLAAINLKLLYEDEIPVFIRLVCTDGSELYLPISVELGTKEREQEILVTFYWFKRSPRSDGFIRCTLENFGGFLRSAGKELVRDSTGLPHSLSQCRDYLWA